jgi:hypothetical protein
LGEDLVFRKAGPIAGGREFLVNAPAKNAQETSAPKLETGSISNSYNNFQGRYAIRHPWKGPIACENPRRGKWGGPPAGATQHPTAVAKDLAFAPRGGTQLASFVRHDVPEIHLQGAPATMARVTHPGVVPQSEVATKPNPSAAPVSSVLPPATSTPPASSSGCGACAVGRENTANTLGFFSGITLALASFMRRKNRRRG